MSTKVIFDADGVNAEDFGHRLIMLGEILTQAKDNPIPEGCDTIWFRNGYTKLLPIKAYVECEWYNEETEEENWGVVNIDVETHIDEDKYCVTFSRGFLAWASRNETFNELMELKENNDETETDNAD